MTRACTARTPTLPSSWRRLRDARVLTLGIGVCLGLLAKLGVLGLQLLVLVAQGAEVPDALDDRFERPDESAEPRWKKLKNC